MNTLAEPKLAAMKLDSIQCLRAIAAIAVVFGHSSTSLFANGQSLVPLSHAGARGVDLFFVISGFLMFFTTDHKTVLPSKFFQKRLTRIVPLYFLLSTFGFVMAVISPHSFQMLTANPWDYLRSILFIPFYNTHVHLIRPELGKGWTLNYEMFFYLIFGVSLLMTRTLRLAFITGVFLVLSLIGFVFHPSNPILETYCDSLSIEFLFGVVLSYFISNQTVVSKRERNWVLSLFTFSVILTAVQIGIPAVADWLPRCIGTGIPAASIIAGAVYLERTGRIRRLSFALLLGDASYSLYLSHIFVLGAVRRIWAKEFNVNLVSTHVGFMVVAAAISVIIGIGVYLLVEKPMTDRLSKKPKRVLGKEIQMVSNEVIGEEELAS